jgi:hypothetical protein
MKKKQRNPSRTVSEARVGIFWLVGENLLFDMTPLSKAEAYGNFKIHSGNHISIWEQFRLAGIVSPEAEYEEYPRGRVAFDAKTQQFSLLADRCILRRKKLVADIKKEMHLPKSTSVSSDYHYRCFACLKQSGE